MPAEERRHDRGERADRSRFTAEQGAYVGKNSELEKNVVCEPFSSVGDNSKLGKGTEIGRSSIVGDNTTLEERVQLGSRCLVGEGQMDNATRNPRSHDGSTQTEKELVAYHQVKSVDRTAEPRPTTIDRGTKLEDGAYVMEGSYVGRDCEIGRDAAVHRDATVGDQCHIGQSAQIGDDARVGNQSALDEGAMVGAQAKLADKTVLTKNEEVPNQGDGSHTRNEKQDREDARAKEHQEARDAAYKKETPRWAQVADRALAAVGRAGAALAAGVARAARALTGRGQKAPEPRAPETKFEKAVDAQEKWNPGPSGYSSKGGHDRRAEDHAQKHEPPEAPSREAVREHMTPKAPEAPKPAEQAKAAEQPKPAEQGKARTESAERTPGGQGPEPGGTVAKPKTETAPAKSAAEKPRAETRDPDRAGPSAASSERKPEAARPGATQAKDANKTAEAESSQRKGERGGRQEAGAVAGSKAEARSGPKNDLQRLVSQHQSGPAQKAQRTDRASSRDGGGKPEATRGGGQRQNDLQRLLQRHEQRRAAQSQEVPSLRSVVAKHRNPQAGAEGNGASDRRARLGSSPPPPAEAPEPAAGASARQSGQERAQPEQQR